MAKNKPRDMTIEATFSVRNNPAIIKMFVDTLSFANLIAHIGKCIEDKEFEQTAKEIQAGVNKLVPKLIQVMKDEGSSYVVNVLAIRGLASLYVGVKQDLEDSLDKGMCAMVSVPKLQEVE